MLPFRLSRLGFCVPLRLVNVLTMSVDGLRTAVPLSDETLKFGVVCPQHEAAVLEGFTQ